MPLVVLGDFPSIKKSPIGILLQICLPFKWDFLQVKKSLVLVFSKSLMWDSITCSEVRNVVYLVCFPHCFTVRCPSDRLVVMVVMLIRMMK